MLQEQAKEEAAAGLTPIPNQAKAPDDSTQGWTNNGNIQYNDSGDTSLSQQEYRRQFWDETKNRFSAVKLLFDTQPYGSFHSTFGVTKGEKVQVNTQNDIQNSTDLPRGSSEFKLNLNKKDFKTYKIINGYEAKINVGQQNKHIPGTNEFKTSIANGNARSIMNGDVETIQKLLDENAGTGSKIGNNKERIDFGKVIGQYVDPVTHLAWDTTIGIIHYGKNGAHIVPPDQSNYNRRLKYG